MAPKKPNFLLERLTGMFAGLLGGYFIGMAIGFTVFDPDLDVWALLGALLACVGMVVGVLGLLQRQVIPIFTTIIGFYTGMILGILLFKDPTEDGMIELLREGGPGLVVCLALTIGGAWIGTRLPNTSTWRFRLASGVTGGFFGGLLFAALLGENTDASPVALAPIIFGTAALCILVTERRRRHSA